MGQCSGSAALIVELPLYADASSEVQFYGELRQIDHGSCNKQWHFQRFPSEPIDISLAGLDDSVTFIFALYVADPANFPFERAGEVEVPLRRLRGIANIAFHLWLGVKRPEGGAGAIHFDRAVALARSFKYPKVCFSISTKPDPRPVSPLHGALALLGTSSFAKDQVGEVRDPELDVFAQSAELIRGLHAEFRDQQKRTQASRAVRLTGCRVTLLDQLLESKHSAESTLLVLRAFRALSSLVRSKSNGIQLTEGQQVALDAPDAQPPVPRKLNRGRRVDMKVVDDILVKPVSLEEEASLFSPLFSSHVLEARTRAAEVFSVSLASRIIPIAYIAAGEIRKSEGKEANTLSSMAVPSLDSAYEPRVEAQWLEVDGASGSAAISQEHLEQLSRTLSSTLTAIENLEQLSMPTMSTCRDSSGSSTSRASSLDNVEDYSSTIGVLPGNAAARASHGHLITSSNSPMRRSTSGPASASDTNCLAPQRATPKSPRFPPAARARRNPQFPIPKTVG